MSIGTLTLNPEGPKRYFGFLLRIFEIFFKYSDMHIYPINMRDNYKINKAKKIELYSNSITSSSHLCKIERDT